MFHAWDITIPAGTPDNAPLVQELPLTAGVITKVEIKFPMGCNGLVKVRLSRWTFQLVPLTKNQWVTGNNETVPSETHYELLEHPFFLMFEGSSPSTTYAHRITIRINVEQETSAQEQNVLERLDKIVEAVT
jgi:hypothetical protein